MGEIKCNPECPRLERCNAGLCPPDPLIEKRIWYPDEEICKRKGFGNTDFVKVQKKIKRVKADPNRFFNVQMLRRIHRVAKGIKGIDPDKEKQLERWIETHPETKKRKFTPQQIKEFKERMKTSRIMHFKNKKPVLTRCLVR